MATIAKIVVPRTNTGAVSPVSHPGFDKEGGHNRGSGQGRAGLSNGKTGQLPRAPRLEGPRASRIY